MDKNKLSELPNQSMLKATMPQDYQVVCLVMLIIIQVSTKATWHYLNQHLLLKLK